MSPADRSSSVRLTGFRPYPSVRKLIPIGIRRDAVGCFQMPCKGLGVVPADETLGVGFQYAFNLAPDYQPVKD